MYFLIPETQSWKAARALKLSGAKDPLQKPENPYKAIFENPKHRLMFILWSMSSGLLLFGYFGVSNSAAFLFRNRAGY